MSELFNTNLQYLFVHVLVHNKDLRMWYWSITFISKLKVSRRYKVY